MTNHPTEVEAALLVCSPTPRVVADAIAQLTTLDGYGLQPQPDQHIQDVHFDSAGFALRGHGIALRARGRNGSRYITLKGPARLLDNGSTSRLEIECPWTPDGLRQVASALGGMRIAFPDLPPVLAADNPAASLKAAGFAVLQSRSTQRRVRNVVAPGTSVVLCELAIDAVRYELDGGDVSLSEVEIEAKSSEAEVIVPRCVSALLTMFQPALRRWPYGKLLTGSAIDQLLRSGSLEGLLDQDRSISPDACDSIETFLRLTY